VESVGTQNSGEWTKSSMVSRYIHSLLQIDCHLFVSRDYTFVPSERRVADYFAVHLSRNLLDSIQYIIFQPFETTERSNQPSCSVLRSTTGSGTDAFLLPRYPLLVLNLGHGTWGLKDTDLPPPLPAQASSATSKVAPWPISNYRCNNQLRCSNP
jgi:hypothetical protein